MANASQHQLGDEDAKALFQIVVNRKANLCSAIDFSMDLYSRAINANFASHILRLLPREIRDMIYHQLVNSERVVHERCGKKHMEDVTVPIRGVKRQESGKTYLAPLRTVESFPHFYNIEYMGVEFASELFETAYRHHNFAFDHQAEVPAFLSNCMFGTGLNPAAHVTSLTIGITLNRLNASAMRELEWNSSKWNYPLERHFQKAVKPLDVLKKIASKRGSSIQFSNQYGRNDYDRKFAEVLMPLIYELKEKGWKVLCWKPEFEGPWKTLTFDSSRDAWHEKIKTDSVFASDEPEKWKRWRYRMRSPSAS
ncbi:hypothetical protein BDU57DRAFT_532983 [Ampelomyces quisqualis]|uniref:Uncharacterized protein n=1 Tax=Ampelomyces quisqualis TaxID=50730 RepID=A0A6A5QBB2_AMPQU|nr:hypothetical protein BDU57DRAFT_532983 [Ampelomyces quisqualis]